MVVVLLLDCHGDSSQLRSEFLLRIRAFTKPMANKAEKGESGCFSRVLEN